MTTQKQVLISACAAIVLGSSMGMVSAQTPAKKKVELEQAEYGSTIVSVVGEITAVDVANRVVSIKGPRGNIGEMKVDPAVKNLDKVKVGDRARIRYQVALAVALMKGGDGIRERVETEAGSMPGASATKRVTIVANVESVNAKRGIVTLRGAEGNFVDVKVRDPALLREVKAGDQVVASVTETVAVGVQPVTAK
ncbi:hypothetical protein QTI66_37540 [Variovorax sp. J22R133]|uniref:hypothetical protein n=1 Tax=Variovorax brevis TaxID=3053503 RepID=UPI0025774914|nr:hypothetical protein [Variovorax sp. J22R133]MDM0117802.1 hypothetical protein [Variovorax sp. J22R133]